MRPPASSLSTSQGLNDSKGLKLYDKCLLRNTQKRVSSLCLKKKNNKKKSKQITSDTWETEANV